MTSKLKFLIIFISDESHLLCSFLKNLILIHQAMSTLRPLNLWNSSTHLEEVNSFENLNYTSSFKESVPPKLIEIYKVTCCPTSKFSVIFSISKSLNSGNISKCLMSSYTTSYDATRVFKLPHILRDHKKLSFP